MRAALAPAFYRSRALYLSASIRRNSRVIALNSYSPTHVVIDAGLHNRELPWASRRTQSRWMPKPMMLKLSAPLRWGVDMSSALSLR